MSVTLDTWTKYIVFQVFIAVIVISNVYINEVAGPILGFNIYNPDKKEITEFTRIELQLYANTIWMINALKSVTMIVISISQIDIALLRVIYGEIMSWFTIRMLLLEKKFTKEDTPLEYEMIPPDEV